MGRPCAAGGGLQIFGDQAEGGARLFQPRDGNEFPPIRSANGATNGTTTSTGNNVPADGVT